MHRARSTTLGRAERLRLLEAVRYGVDEGILLIFVRVRVGPRVLRRQGGDVLEDVMHRAVRVSSLAKCEAIQASRSAKPFKPRAVLSGVKHREADSLGNYQAQPPALEGA